MGYNQYGLPKPGEEGGYRSPMADKTPTPIDEATLAQLIAQKLDILTTSNLIDRGPKSRRNYVDIIAGEIKALVEPYYVEKGRQMEREKFVTTLEKEYPAITTWQCWQALKEGKDG